jgi:hypothetical protein
MQGRLVEFVVSARQCPRGVPATPHARQSIPRPRATERRRSP